MTSKVAIQPTKQGRWVLAVIDDDDLMTPIITRYWCNQCWKPGKNTLINCPNCNAKMNVEVKENA